MLHFDTHTVQYHNRMHPFLLSTLLLLAPSAAEYVWPSWTDSMEDLLYLQSGYIRNGALSDQVVTCAFGGNQPGIQKSAEWLRTAFHDAATHDASTKTGGLDGSIQYELDRSENLGSALNSTLADISSSINIYSSAADLLALAMVMAVARCGDLHVPLRLGRKDATEAGIMGVPEAHTDLETTRRRFEISGFNTTEMITLVACGHTIGGVHSVDHPEIVINGPADPANVARFDNTTGTYDNRVVTEYLDNTSQNPLLRNTNDTLNSDKRIFSADGNQTMSRLADPTVFKAQCESLLERMINLVPGDVTLTEPHQPADIRPYIQTYLVKGNGSLELAGRVRVRTSDVTGRNTSDLTVALLPTDRAGAALPEIPANIATFRSGISSGYLRERFQWYEFNTTIPATTAIQSFNIRLTTLSTGNAIVYDNAGTGGYPVNPDILFLRPQSCTSFDTATNTGTMTINVAISKSLLSQTATPPQIRIVQKTPQPRNFIPKLTDEVVPLEKTGRETAQYTFYQAKPVVGSSGLSTSFDVEVGDSKLEFQETGDMTGRSCALF
ncbi:heme peroxidase [Elsinoe ampelina]|uniref:Peroxidase n=1 Tax=Elsinoe ampelina TaxID=302913 RepID=A0A6A6GFA5_9PEZI|nr:heme peroxidase [Elsinoe ampelina]